MRAKLLGRAWTFETAPGLFSADRVDDGTRLLLAHLPERAPRSVLDLGCGWGALALPIAGAFAEARVVAVDRDLLAVQVTAGNARSAGLANVEARGSLGLDAVRGTRFDWILCNVPARIGPRAVAAFVAEGRAQLEPEGELRVVVIRDLAPALAALAGVREVARGKRHAVFACGPGAPIAPEPEIYTRDVVEIGGTRFERPHDLGEEPAHLRDGVPLLLEIAPRAPRGRVLVHPAGYGALAVSIAARGAEVVAVDRDLLAAAFTERNAAGVAIEVRRAPALAAALVSGEHFELALLELQPAAREDVARRDLVAALAFAPEALLLGPERLIREWIVPAGARLVATRGGYAVAQGRRR